MTKRGTQTLETVTVTVFFNFQVLPSDNYVINRSIKKVFNNRFCEQLIDLVYLLLQASHLLLYILYFWVLDCGTSVIV